MKQLIYLVLFASISYAQAWSGIISSTRAVDWSTVGVVGDIPSGTWTNCVTASCNTLFGGSVTATTIANAISSASANTVVRIPAGSFSVGPFNITKSSVVLRGAGADQTKLSCTSGNSGGGLGGTNNPCIHLMSGATGVGSFGGVVTANWTAGYSQGTTVVTLSSTSGLTAGAVGTGSIIMLNQIEDSTDGYPSAGDIYACAHTNNNCSNQGGNNYGVATRSVVQVVTVTAINGSNVTISPAIAFPNFRSGQTPQAYWNTGSPISNTGIEDLTLDFSPSGTQGVYIMNAANCWLKGMRFISTATGTQETYHIFLLQSVHITVRSNYIYGRPTTQSPFPLANYPYSTQETSDALLENNIFHDNTESMVPNDPGGRNVYAYNYVNGDAVGVAGNQFHSGSIMMDLLEGNNMQTVMGDVTHGSHSFLTMFRNHLDGTAHNNSGTTPFAIGFLTNNRFMNVVGNVIGSTSYSAGYESTLSNNNAAAVFNLGWEGNNSGSTVTSDTNVKRTLFRWANWDYVTSSGDTGTNDQTGTRFCGNSSNTGWVARCSSTTEVPSGITNFPNAIPSAETLPASFYLASQPAWWATAYGTPAYPAIGFDVSNGDATNTSSVPTGGHAYKIPARLCYENAANDSAYPSSSPRIKVFNASTCYASVSTSVPSVSFGGSITIH